MCEGASRDWILLNCMDAGPKGTMGLCRGRKEGHWSWRGQCEAGLWPESLLPLPGAGAVGAEVADEPVLLYHTFVFFCSQSVLLSPVFLVKLVEFPELNLEEDHVAQVLAGCRVTLPGVIWLVSFLPWPPLYTGSLSPLVSTLCHSCAHQSPGDSYMSHGFGMTLDCIWKGSKPRLLTLVDKISFKLSQAKEGVYWGDPRVWVSWPCLPAVGLWTGESSELLPGSQLRCTLWFPVPLSFSGPQLVSPSDPGPQQWLAQSQRTSLQGKWPHDPGRSQCQLQAPWRSLLGQASVSCPSLALKRPASATWPISDTWLPVAFPGIEDSL